MEPKLLAVLALGKKFSLIGDYKQLSPIIKSPKAMIKGMGISLLEKLCKAHPTWACNLTEQVKILFF